VQNRVIQQVLGSSKPITVGWPLKLMRAFPFLRRIPARMLGVGFRPEHVKTPDVLAAANPSSAPFASGRAL
jgi:hypothetical protein